MEKIIESYVLNDVIAVINKHIQHHVDWMEESRKAIDLIEDLEMTHIDLYEEKLNDLNSSASAIAGLIMLKRELNGEVEY